MGNAIGEYISELRQEKGWTLRELGEKSNVSHTEISRIEVGSRANPSPHILRSIALALETDYVELMRLAGYIHERVDHDSFYELVFKDADGNIVDIKRGVKEMFRRDEEWANMAYRASRELSNEDKELLKGIVLQLLERNRKND